MARKVKLTASQLCVLRAVSNGACLGLADLRDCSWLERNGFIEEIKNGFISSVSFLITPAGRAALSASKREVE